MGDLRTLVQMVLSVEEGGSRITAVVRQFQEPCVVADVDRADRGQAGVADRLVNEARRQPADDTHLVQSGPLDKARDQNHSITGADLGVIRVIGRNR